MPAVAGVQVLRQATTILVCGCTRSRSLNGTNAESAVERRQRRARSDIEAKKSATTDAVERSRNLYSQVAYRGEMPRAPVKIENSSGPAVMKSRLRTTEAKVRDGFGNMNPADHAHHTLVGN
jgi:hypothetical protein